MFVWVNFLFLITGRISLIWTLFVLVFHFSFTYPPRLKLVMWWNTSLSFVDALEVLGLLQEISLLMQIQPNGYHENEIEIRILIRFILRRLVKRLLISSQKMSCAPQQLLYWNHLSLPLLYEAFIFCSKQGQRWLYVVLLNSGDNLNIRPALICCTIYIMGEKGRQYNLLKAVTGRNSSLDIHLKLSIRPYRFSSCRLW